MDGARSSHDNLNYNLKSSIEGPIQPQTQNTNGGHKRR